MCYHPVHYQNSNSLRTVTMHVGRNSISFFFKIIFKKITCVTGYPGLCQAKYRVSVARWVERWYGTPEALSSSHEWDLTCQHHWHLIDADRKILTILFFLSICLTHFSYSSANLRTDFSERGNMSPGIQVCVSQKIGSQ